MRYELFLRRSDGALEDQALASIAQRVAGGKTQLVLEVYRSDRSNEALGVDLGVELGVETGAACRLVELALALAAEHGLTVYDPQLGRTVAAGAAEQVVAHYERTAAFTGGEQLGQGGHSPAGGPASARIWIYLAGAVVALFLASRLLTCWI